MNVSGFFKRMTDKVAAAYEYCKTGIWSDTQVNFKTNLIKTLNITVKSFLSADIQTQACAMTYRTILAIVPALAMIFAIGRGFGFQGLLHDELYQLFPSQKSLIDHTLSFVDSYLDQASEGIFVGVGLVFLLYTVISLLINVEDTFNLIWNVRNGRSMVRKITDYTAILLILPVLMICGGGLNVFLSSNLQKLLHFSFMTPIISLLFEFGSFLFTCLFFTAMFMMIPNTKVKLQNAAMAGLFTGVGFIVLQWLFVSGQLYVAKYNAIYGSFSFLPLFMIWMQLVWVIVMIGSLICYASQNIFQFTYSDKINNISQGYATKVALAICTVIVKKFVNGKPPVTDEELIKNYGIPARLVTTMTGRLVDAGILSIVMLGDNGESTGYQPAMSPQKLTVNYVLQTLNALGNRAFIPAFEEHFPGVEKITSNIYSTISQSTDNMLLQDIDIQEDINTLHM